MIFFHRAVSARSVGAATQVIAFHGDRSGSAGHRSCCLLLPLPAVQPGCSCCSLGQSREAAVRPVRHRSWTVLFMEVPVQIKQGTAVLGADAGKHARSVPTQSSALWKQVGCLSRDGHVGAGQPGWQTRGRQTVFIAPSSRGHLTPARVVRGNRR